jgi:hypothetical protein
MTNAFRTHGNQRSQWPDPAFGIDPIDRYVGQSAQGIAQRVLNGLRRADPYHLVAKFGQRAGDRRLTDIKAFNQLACGQRPGGQSPADGVGVP